MVRPQPVLVGVGEILLVLKILVTEKPYIEQISDPPRMSAPVTMIKNAQLPKPYKNRHTTIVFPANAGGDVRGSSLSTRFSTENLIFLSPH